MNNNYARNTHTRSIAISNKFIFTVALVLAIVFAIGMCSVLETTAYAAVQDVKNIGTYLYDGQGLVLGSNMLRPTSSQVEKEYVSGLGNGASDSRFGDDFYFELNTADWEEITGAGGVPNRVGYTADGFYLNYFTDNTEDMTNAKSFSFNSKIRLQDNSSLSSALKSSTGKVAVAISLNYEYFNVNKLSHETEPDVYEGGYQDTDTFDIEVAWVPDGVNAQLLEQVDTYTVQNSRQKAVIPTIYLNTAGFDPDNAYLSIKIGNFKTDNAISVIEGTDVKYTTGIFARFSNVNVSVVNAVDYKLHFQSTGARVADTTSNSRDDAYTIYSPNESVYFEGQTVTTTSTNYNLVSTVPGSNSYGEIFVKNNDMLYLYSDVYMTMPDQQAVPMPLSADYANSVKSEGKAIQWVYTDNSYFSTFSQNLSLRDYSNTIDQTSGRTTVYSINYGTSAANSERKIQLRPKIIYSYTEDPQNPNSYIYNEVTEQESRWTTIYIDNVRPATPNISNASNSSLGYYGYNTAVYGNISEQNIEKRYTQGLTISFAVSNIADINTAGTKVNDNNVKVAPESIYYTVNGENPTSAKSDRHKATLSGGVGTINLNTPENGGVGKGAGFYEIKLVTIDAAGNYSDVVTYRIVVDNKKYQVNSYVVGGESEDAKNVHLTPNQSTASGVAQIEMSQGEAGSDFSTVTSVGYYRGSDVTFKVTMTPGQMKEYQLVSVYNEGRGESALSWDQEDITFTKEGDNYVYYVTVKMDKHIDPYLDSSGNIIGFSIMTQDDFYYVYDGSVYSAGSDGIVSASEKIGTYTPMLPNEGILNINLGAYASSPRLYNVVLEGNAKGLYALTADTAGDLLHNGISYATSMVPNTLIDIEGTTVNLIDNTDANVRVFCFAFKQKVSVDVTNTNVTFSYDKSDALSHAVAKQQGVNITPNVASTSSLHPGETFGGLKDDFEITYYGLVSNTYTSIASLLSALDVTSSKSLDFKNQALAQALADGHLALYTESTIDGEIVPYTGNNATIPRYAGEYWYTATIKSTSTFNSDFFYYEHGTLIINKASAMVSNSLMFGEINANNVLVTRPLVYGTGGMATMDNYIYGLDDMGYPSNTITTIGVMGKYTVDTDNINYNNPSAGTVLVNVTFTPDVINTYGNNSYTILNRDNIETQTIAIMLTVAKAEVAIEVDEKSLTTEYNGSNQEIQVKLQLHNDLQFMPLSSIPNTPGSRIIVNSGLTIDTSNLTVKYLYKSQAMTDFSASVPQNAGLYDVKILVEGDNYWGELVISDRYFGDSSSILGQYDGEFFVNNNGEQITIPTASSTVASSVHGYVMDGKCYYIVGNRVVSISSSAEQVSIIDDGTTYTLSQDGVITKHALYNGVFYQLTAIDAVSGVEQYGQNASYSYSKYFVIDGSRYYYDGNYVYTDKEQNNVVGSVTNNRVLTISTDSYYIGNNSQLYTMAEDASIVDEGLLADINFDSATSTILVYNGTFSYDGVNYVVTNNNVYKRMVFEITKQLLKIESGLEESYEYTYYSVPTANSAMYAYAEELAEDGQMRPSPAKPVAFSISYKYSATADGEFVDVIESDVTAFNAGYYQVLITIVANNYQGSVTDTFRIDKVSELSSHISIGKPFVVNAMTYGQTLKDILLTTGALVNVTFTNAKNNNVLVGDADNFRVATSAEEYDAYGINFTGEKTHQDTIFSAIGTRDYYVLFIPDDLVNFEAFAVPVSVKVDPANPLYVGDKEGTWDAHFVKNNLDQQYITYGDAFSSAVLKVANTTVKGSANGSLFFYYGDTKTAVPGSFTVYTDASTVFDAGEHYVDYTFTPNDSDRFNSVNFTVVLNVQKKDLTLNYTSENYTIPYGGSVNILSGITNQEGLTVEGYEYKLYNYIDRQEEIEYATTLAAGTYYVVVDVVDDNYSGRLGMDFVIEKATPIVLSAPIVDSFEWDMTLGELNVNNGTAIITNQLSQETINGSFAISYDGVDYDQSKTYREEFIANSKTTYQVAINLEFTPSADYIDNYNVFSYTWTLTVNRVTLDVGKFSFSDKSRVYTGSALYPTVHVNVDGETLDYSQLVSYSDAPIAAGDYNLTVTVTDDNLLYRGAVTTPFTITKRDASNVDISFYQEYVEAGETDPITPWSGVEIPANAIFTLHSDELAENAIVTYTVRVNRGTINNAPIVDVGKYTVTITLTGNYTGTKTFDFVVRYQEVTYKDAIDGVITRTYTADSLQTGRVLVDTISPSNLYYTIEYAPLRGSYSTTVPTEAGIYHARLRFDANINNGYQGYDKGVRIEIKPANTTITVNKLKDFTYTGGALNAADYIDTCFEVRSTHASIETYKYMYSTTGQDGTWTIDPMVDAGTYYMLITPGNDNFDGQAIYQYTIAKGDLTYLGGSNAMANRIETETISYSTFVLRDNDNEYFTQASLQALTFVFDGVSKVVEGNFVIRDREMLSTLYPGSYDNYEFVFTPTGEHANNLNPYVGRVTINIQKLVISDYLTFVEETLKVEYSGTAQSVSIRFKTNDELGDLVPLALSQTVQESIIDSIKIYYDNNQNAPVNVKADLYALTTESTHDNYIVDIQGNMEIIPATPVIITPDYLELERENITQIDLNAIPSIYAVNANGNMALEGTFSWVDGSITDDTDYYAEILFTPADSIANNVKPANATLRIVYYGSTNYFDDADSFTVDTIPTYGATLDEILANDMVKLNGGALDITAGQFSWTDGAVQPKVGTSNYQLVFTPYDDNTDHYKVQLFTVAVTVAFSVEDMGAVYWDVTAGNTYANGSIVITNPGYAHITGFTLTALSSHALADTVDVEHFKSAEIIATITLDSADYYATSIEFSAKVTLKVKDTDFRVLLSKDQDSPTLATEWAGQPITSTDLYSNAQNSLLKILVGNAGYNPACTITIFNKDGQEIDEIPAIGVYTIAIDIDRSKSNYAGQTTVTFTVTAKDLSQYILVNGNDNDVALSKVYTQSLSIIPTLDLEALGGTVSEDDYELIRYYKRRSDPDSAYTPYNIPFNAGQYDVKIVIANSDYYQGEKVYSYTIEKQAISITLNGTNLVTSGGYVLEAEYGRVSIPTLALGEGVKKYTISYTDGKTTYLTTPQNAGEYTATVTVVDTNYTGQATFTLSIAKRETLVYYDRSTLLSPIDYGTLTRNAVMSSSWSASVDGYMTIVDGDSILNAGVNTVQVLFTPYNENYESKLIEVDLIVNRAIATLLTFNTTELVYTGEEIAVSYTKLSFVDDSDIAFSFYTLQGATLTPAIPIAAGEYYVRVVVGSETGNYYYTNVAEEGLGIASNYQKIIIKQATAIGYVPNKEPQATDIEYGTALLGNSYITGDVALYDDGKGGTVEVRGVYTFRNGTAPQYKVGELKVELVFTPNNTNYATYYPTVYINVIQALVNIEVVDGTTITYGDMINVNQDEPDKFFTFNIDQHNDLVEYLEFNDYTWNNYVYNKLLPSGSYSMVVELKHDHYRGQLNFVLTVQKKPIDLAFYLDSGRGEAIDMATGYSFGYQSTANVYAGVATDLADFSALIGKSETAIREDIHAKTVLTYTHIESGKTYSNISNVVKTAGTYRVTATLLTSLDYTATAWTYVTITRAPIGKIELDQATLRQQTYGSVAEPIVYIYNDADNPVRLTGISYYIHWGDSATMPTSAGEHNATVIINDPNYVYTEKNIVMVIKKKPIVLTNIQVNDKVYDGTPWLQISATMSGAILGDEIGLNLTAHTADKDATAGKHNVTIANYSLYGLHKDNYYVVTPAYNQQVEIYSNVINSTTGDSYLLFSGKVQDQYSFEVQEIESSYNRTGFISTILGQSAQVVSFSVRQDGLKVQLEEPVHVYVKIPEKYKDRVDLEYSFVGTGGEDIVFNREGDYISFYTTVSGEIVFSTSAFPYGIILIATGLVLMLGGILVIHFLDPAKKKVGFSGIRRKTPVDEAYRKLNEQKIKRDNTPPQYNDGKKHSKK